MARRRRPTIGIARPVGGVIPGAPLSPLPPVPRRRPGIVKPPAGMYDPALDAAEGQTRRGFEDLQADYIRDYGDTGSGGRRRHDYEMGTADLTRQRDEGFADLSTSLSRGTANYQSSLADLARDFSRLGTRQAEAARSRGVLSSGLAQLAAARRAENQALARQPLDLNYSRFVEDVERDRSRLGEGTDRGLAALALGYGRDVTDAGTGLTRAQRETDQFGIDTQASRLHSATALGYQTPQDLADAAREAAKAEVRQQVARARRRRRGGR